MGCESDQVATLDWGGQERSLKRQCYTHILNHKQQPAGKSGDSVSWRRTETKQGFSDMIPWKCLGNPQVFESNLMCTLSPSLQKHH